MPRFLGFPDSTDKELRMAQLSLKHIQKIYDNPGVHVVKDFNLDIEDKEFIVSSGHRAAVNRRRCV